MKIEEKLFNSINEFQHIAQERICDSAEKWLNLAYKFDYISLPCKERIDELLRKTDEVRRFNARHSFSEQDVEDMTIIAEIAAATRFSNCQIESR